LHAHQIFLVHFGIFTDQLPGDAAILGEYQQTLRIDIQTSGWREAKQLISEDSKVDKEYLVRVQGTLKDSGLALLNQGLKLDGEYLKPAKVTWQNEDQLRFVLREGKKRQIRRMCELVELKVTGLKRIRIGKVKLGNLPVGQWRYLGENEQF